MKDSIEVLDCTIVHGFDVLLDGKGAYLPHGAEPVFLRIDRENHLTATNSRGEPFNPPISLWNFIQSNGDPEV
jgi:hypothetical protein